MSYHILVVDDEIEVTKMLQVFLMKNGYDVTCAADGAQAIQMAQKQPDLILLDINMPQVDGIDVGSLLEVKLFEHFSNFVRYFHEAIRCIKRVIVPQIDNSHNDLRFGWWLTSDQNEGGGERHRGMTSGQHAQSCPIKTQKRPGGMKPLGRMK